MVHAGGSFRVLCAEDPQDLASWIRRWQSWPRREIFAHPHYVKTLAREEGQSLCACWEGEEGRVLYPFILRDLTAAPYAVPSLGPATDIITPYGYGGAHFWGAADASSLAACFWPRFDAWAGQNGVVSEFARFSLFSDSILPYPGTEREDRRNVVRDLRPDQEALWMDFKHKVRKNVNRARQSALRVEIDSTGARLAEFLRIYRRTMQRRNAREEYLFPAEVFQRIHGGLAGQFAYFHAIHQRRTVSTELVLISADSVYSFLGGTDQEAFDLRPNDLLKYEIMRWAKSQGKRWFVLGGGHQPEDGIFRYKVAFAPHGIVPFKVGSRILRKDAYDALVKARRDLAHPGVAAPHATEHYFPAYRS